MTRFSSMVLLVALGGCSALLNPDESRLGGGEDGGVTDDGAVGVDSAMDAAGMDAGVDADRRDTSPPDDAGMDAPPVIDAGCTTPPSCSGGEVTTCDGVTPCALGCAPGGEARCAEMVPSNVSADLWVDDARDVTVLATGEGTLFDTSVCDSRMAESRVVTQAGGGEVCALMVRNLTVRTGGFLAVRGDRPLVVMAIGDVVIEEGGVIDVSARGAQPGPGGAFGGQVTGGLADGRGDGGGGAGRHRETFQDGGGGGGAFCGDGGDGGQGDRAAGGEGAGAIPTELLIPLRAGSGGGLGEGGRPSVFPGGDANGNTGPGGAGGGALQISALGTIRVDGFIVAAGGGGSGGNNSSFFSNFGAGGGGGSGGAVLLEAPMVTLGGGAGVTTSGGGGGGGASNGGGGGDGDDGWQTLDRASGGASGGTRFGAEGGDSGGGSNLGGVDGDSNTMSNANGGGGGGGVGCVVYRNLSGSISGASAHTSGSVDPALQSAPIMLR